MYDMPSTKPVNELGVGFDYAETNEAFGVPKTEAHYDLGGGKEDATYDLGGFEEEATYDTATGPQYNAASAAESGVMYNMANGAPEGNIESFMSFSIPHESLRCCSL